jgi:hypothetical protein
VGWILPPPNIGGLETSQHPKKGYELVLGASTKAKSYAEWIEIGHVQDFTLTFRYRHGRPDKGPGVTGDILIRLSGQGPQAGRGYHIEIDNSQVSLWRESATKKVPLGQPAKYPFKAGQWYNVTIEAKGKQFNVTIDSQTVLKNVPDPQPLPAGGIALGCLDGKDFRYDDVVLKVNDCMEAFQISLTAQPASGATDGRKELTAKVTLHDVPVLGAGVDWGVPKGGGQFASSGTNAGKPAKTDETGCCSESWIPPSGGPAGKSYDLRLSVSARYCTGGVVVAVGATDAKKMITLSVLPVTLQAGQQTNLRFTATQDGQAPPSASVDWIASGGRFTDSGKSTRMGATMDQTGSCAESWSPAGGGAPNYFLSARVKQQGVASTWGEADVTVRSLDTPSKPKPPRPIAGCTLTATPKVVQVGEKTELVFKAPPQSLPRDGANVSFEADGGSLSLNKSDPLSAPVHRSANGHTDKSGAFTLYWGFPGGVSKGSYTIRASVSYRSPDGDVSAGQQSLSVIVRGPVRVEGTIHMVMAVGAESTGIEIRTKDAAYELDVGTNKDLRDKAAELAKKKTKAEVTGTLKTQKGLEVPQRMIITVATLKEIK